MPHRLMIMEQLAGSTFGRPAAQIAADSTQQVGPTDDDIMMTRASQGDRERRSSSQ